MNIKKNCECSAQHEPRLAGSILLNDILFSNEHPLGIGYCQRKLFEEIFPHTEPGIDLKIISRKPGRMPVGDSINCMLTHDGDYHYTAVENAIEKKAKTVQRNPVIFAGGCVNIHLLADGTKRLAFNRPRFYSDFTFRDFCLAAAHELVTIARLLGEEDSQE